ncbi:hypothetical protein Patl1_04367 [Pistacia atlantica]|uniref:Uncharacterized protein n=1 Tax=Pistacia atlantica TaxID=434234 RepID=A0ACC1BPD8_9ROSI|nr:hypothetical protein Patl1_04367 [Pistacia atlantica]
MQIEDHLYGKKLHLPLLRENLKRCPMKIDTP